MSERDGLEASPPIVDETHNFWGGPTPPKPDDRCAYCGVTWKSHKSVKHRETHVIMQGQSADWPSLEPLPQIGLTREYPYKDGDCLILGPECFLYPSGNVISYKGVDYFTLKEAEKRIEDHEHVHWATPIKDEQTQDHRDEQNIGLFQQAPAWGSESE